ncbi:hypothetical protein KC340_g17593 [Hortaea werneckii]|nr:hypothetical protein KC342_g10433 [Hortaea werneckii]KAI7065790.1 hypothetical protein KC339_g15700 [Hortaea werneckii]KAI7219734.1 hypothetical protein KC365_g12227 [Hortaea werneckii]KAI7289797.1 hypothetical protein KC340_g17593 [Hortaea werneckii]KAI7372255.1 hypothetical protein KC328_g17369 [Hortaea werneckii]
MTNSPMVEQSTEMMASQDDSHFFGIPPEMRNAIYRELLTPEGGRRSLNILAVCKQANHEAKGILYEENDFEVAISGFEALGGRCQTNILFNNRQVRRLKQSLQLAQTPWPSLLLRLPKLVIVLDCSVRSHYRQNDSQTSLVIALNKILYDLWQFLRRSTKLKHVTVRFVGNARLVDYEVGYLAMPFTQDFSGGWDFEKLPADRIRVELESNAALNSFSALEPYYKLSHEARSLLAEAQSKDDAAKQKAWFKTLSKVLFQNRKLLDGKDPLGPATSRELEGLTKEIQVATTEGVVYVQGLTTAS